MNIRQEGDNKVECSGQCNAKTPTTFVQCLTQLPPFLFVHPKRFTFDLEQMQTVKLNHRISFPLRLDLFPYTRLGLHAASAQHEQGEGAGPPTAKKYSGCSRADCEYELAGVIVHKGRAGGGHYYSYVRTLRANAGRGGGSEKNGDWFLFNDDRVSRVFHEQKQPEAGGGGGKHAKSAVGVGLESECFGGEYVRTSTQRWPGFFFLSSSDPIRFPTPHRAFSLAAPSLFSIFLVLLNRFSSAGVPCMRVLCHDACG